MFYPIVLSVLVVRLVLQQVVYGADQQSWGSIRGALRKGGAKDGPVTLVLERRVYDR